MNCKTIELVQRNGEISRGLRQFKSWIYELHLPRLRDLRHNLMRQTVARDLKIFP
jgi:hypothetical protein